MMTTAQEECKGCGKCCKQGGPALHRHDLDLVRSGKIPITSLITIRKGELVHNPLTGAVQPVAVELVKIKGAGKQWDCCYHDGTKGCTIYDYRPQACRALKCWDTEAVIALIEKDTLSRTDILQEDHFILPAIREQDRTYPCHGLQKIQGSRHQLSAELKDQLEKMAGDEMRFRMQIIARFQLQLSDELFYFGRPFFQLLQALGVRVSESPSAGIRLHWDR
ncbi:MAG: YkgJ family cysteine cluster protein [Proteobacteria bacterium]|nr:YkgJ family cysteine cluster protein [Pseudomonadota bacterium]